MAQRFSAALAQGMILESRDRVPQQAPCMEPASLSAVPLSSSLSLYLRINKIKKKKRKKVPEETCRYNSRNKSIMQYCRG